MSDISFSRKYSVREPREEEAYFVPYSDWNRLKIMISHICPERRGFIVASSVFWGVFASALLAVFSVYATKTDALPDWVIPTGWAITISSFILAIACWFIDSQQKNVITTSSEMVLDEMKQIELRYHDSPIK